MDSLSKTGLEEIFYDKELCDALRDLVRNSLCTLEEGYALLSLSNDYERDVELIKKLRNCGISHKLTYTFVAAINSDDDT